MAEELENASAEALLSFKNGAIKFESDQDHNSMHDIKMEPDDIKMEVEDEEVLGPSVLGLKRVGEDMSPSPQPGLVLNRRGMPQRIRKKNRLFYDDDVVNAVLIKTKRNPISKTAQATKKTLGKKPKEEPTKVDSPDRRLGQKVGMRLRNLLKLPKAHKWVCYEWFYSNIDKALFGGDNDFTICLKESFPQLKTHMLTRVEWCKMRRMMGKPRRCSQAFFEEERRELERKRAKIRLLQQRKGGDPTNCKDLPNEIPLQLVIGSKVTARLRKPQDGLFTGSIDAVDTSNNTYRITFERPGLGTHSVPDYEVLSNEPPDTISLSSFSSQFRTRHSGLLPSCTVSPYLPLTSDPLLSAAPPKPKAIVADGTLGGFPIRVLEKIVRLNKILNIKRIRINRLRELNTEAERKKSFGEPISEDFQKRYANKVIELEHLNTHLREILAQVQQHCQEDTHFLNFGTCFGRSTYTHPQPCSEDGCTLNARTCTKIKKLAPQASVAAMLTPSHIRDQSLADARELVISKHNAVIKDQKILDLVTDLTALMLQVKSLSDSERSSYEVEILNTSMEEIKMKLSPVNQRVFENCVEVHMRHIQTGLGGHLGPLNTSFMAQKV